MPHKGEKEWHRRRPGEQPNQTHNKPRQQPNNTRQRREQQPCYPSGVFYQLLPFFFPFLSSPKCSHVERFRSLSLLFPMPTSEASEAPEPRLHRHTPEEQQTNNNDNTLSSSPSSSSSVPSPCQYINASCRLTFDNFSPTAAAALPTPPSQRARSNSSAECGLALPMVADDEETPIYVFGYGSLVRRERRLEKELSVLLWIVLST